ncbi:MAG: WD40 repeat domain-containing serine/threonine protein kinase [Planctomycetota bacterium]
MSAEGRDTRPDEGAPREPGPASVPTRADASGRQRGAAHRRPGLQEGLGALEARYELGEELGRGGMGVVLRARDLEAGREVALKLLLAQPDARRRARFQREGALAAALRHPGIVAVHSAGEAAGLPYLVYELVPGARPLDEAWAGLERPARLALLAQVARAVGFAHRHGIVHRDLKPANVLVGEDGRPRVTDFGLALELDERERLTRTGATLGTPTHMAPEQAAGERERTGPPADVWALGILLHEAVCGSLPFEDAASPVELLIRLQAARVPGLRERDPSASRDLDAVARRALQRDPAARYPDALAFAEDLEAVLRGERPGAASRVRRGPAAPLAVVLVLALALGVALTLALALGRAPRAAAAGPPARQTPPPSPSASPPQTLDARAVALLAPGGFDPAAALDWLAEAPTEHPRRRALRAEVARAAARPLRSLEHPEARLARFVGPRAALTAGWDDTVRRWDLSTGQEQRRWSVPRGVDRLIARPDGRWVAGRAGDARLWRCDASAAEPRAQELPAPLGALCWSDEQGDELLVGLATGEVLRLAPEGPRGAPARAHDAPVSGILPLPGGGFATCAGIQLPTRKLPVLAVWERPGVVRWPPPGVRRSDTLAVDPSGRVLASGHYDGALQLFDLRERAATGACEGPDSADLPIKVAHRGQLSGLCFARDGRWLYSASASYRGGELRAWEVPSRRLARTWAAGERYGDLDLDPAGHLLLATCHGGPRVDLWLAFPEE